MTAIFCRFSETLRAGELSKFFKTLFPQFPSVRSVLASSSAPWYLKGFICWSHYIISTLCLGYLYIMLLS